jgi:hypothetical protein
MSFYTTSVFIGLPPLKLFYLPPHPAPQAMLPEVHEKPTLLRPFTIPKDVFHYSLDIRVATTVAVAYVTTVISLNHFNDRRKNRSWSLSRTSIFKPLVLVHNLILAAFSTWVFYGMCHTIASSWPDQGQPHYSARVAHYLCRVNDSGLSLWNQGLDYYAWIFYFAKFYEVFDTLIVLAKGKRCSNLQLYHHAGVMVCSCVGLRYMTPASLVGVSLNSAIHALMVCSLSFMAAFPPLRV